MATAGNPAGRSVPRGIGLFLASTVLFAVMDALIKWLTAGYPTQQLLFFRAAFGLVPVLLGLLIAGKLGRLRTVRLRRHILRGVINTGSTFSFFFAYKFLPLADVYAIAFGAPLFATALSGPLLKERVGPRRWAAVLTGFTGVIVMLRPGSAGLSGLFSLGAAAALAGSLLYALNAITARDLGRTDSSSAMVVYSTVVTMLCGAGLLAFGFVLPDWPDLALLIVIGLLGGCGALCFAEAFRLAPIAILAPFEYTAMLWAVALGYIVWRDLPDAWILAGSAIVIASGLFILHEETQAARRARQGATA